MATFYVKVVYGSGQPAKGSRVRLGFYGLSRGMTDEVYTDSDGVARISGYDEGEADVYVDGRTAISHEYMSDGKQVTIKI
jgi:hypothetical protein